MQEKHKHMVKLVLMILALTGILTWVGYRFFHPNTKIEYNDFTIDSAITWLDNADAGKFDVCEKDVVDKNGWFDWYKKDRATLKDLKKRSLLQKQTLPGESKGLKRYELTFDSKFSAVTRRNAKVSERVIVESDGKQQFKVCIADYPRLSFTPMDQNFSESENKLVTALAEKILEKINRRDIDFFKRSFAEYAQRANYFGWNGWWLQQAKKPTKTLELFKILDNGNPSTFKFNKVRSCITRGRTGFQSNGVEYRFSINEKGKQENYKLEVFIERDLYKDKSAPWAFWGFWFWKEKKKEKK